jgi:hypothetical protein
MFVLAAVVAIVFVADTFTGELDHPVEQDISVRIAVTKPLVAPVCLNV